MSCRSAARVSTRIIAAALISPLLSAAPARCQAPSQAAQQPSPAAETVGVDLVNIDVYATDKSGQPVTDLAREDFEVLEDGKPVALTHFSRFEGGRPVPSPQALEAAVRTGDFPAAARPEEILHLVLYFDYSNMRSGSRGGLFRALDGFLSETLKPEDRVMIVTYDHVLKVHRSFRSGGEMLLSDFDELEKGVGRGAQAEAERRQVVRQIEQASVERIGGEIVDAKDTAIRVRTVATAEYERIQVALKELQRFTESLAGLPGRKAVLYVGDGIPTYPGRALFEAWTNKFSQYTREAGVGNAISETRHLDLTPRLRELVSRANSTRVTFYAIDSSASQGAGGVSADAQGGFDPQAMRMRGSGRVYTSDVAVTEELEARGGLEYIARGTGGLFALNNGKLPGALKRFTADFLSFYSLAYRPPAPEGGKFHQLRVRVQREGVQLRHRGGYYGKSPQERTLELTLTALLSESVPNPLGVRLEAGPQKPEKAGTFRVPIVVKVPISLLALMPQGAGRDARLSLFFVSQDDLGRTSPVSRRSVPIRIPAEKLETAMSQVAGYPMDIVLREGQQRLAVGLHDEYANVRSAASLNIWVGDRRP